MKIYCDFCGSQIETSENKTCPHCGGYYSLDKELINEKERVNRLNELEEEKKRLEVQRMQLENKNLINNENNKRTSMPAGCFYATIALSILGLFFILMMICIALEDAETGSSSTYYSAKTTADASQKNINISISMDPINIPDIPDIPEIPEITLAPDEVGQ